jgi:hypothetical protein
MVIATTIPSNLPVLIHCVRAARDCNDPVSYALDNTVRYVNKGGRDIDEDASVLPFDPTKRVPNGQDAKLQVGFLGGRNRVQSDRS